MKPDTIFFFVMAFFIIAYMCSQTIVSQDMSQDILPLVERGDVTLNMEITL